MPTSLPDNTTPRRLSPRAAVIRRTSLRFSAPSILPLARFTALPADIPLWLRCWRAAPALCPG